MLQRYSSIKGLMHIRHLTAMGEGGDGVGVGEIVGVLGDHI